MKSKRRSTAVVAAITAIVGSVATWLACANHYGSIRMQSRQTPTALMTGPTTETTKTTPLKGYNVFVCGGTADQRKALRDIVSGRGGRVISTVDVETDLVVMATSSGDGPSAQVVQQARELHIPVMDQPRLMRFAPAQ
jgi:NAD-dependent DNA ligase